jgi:hypothetical protein
MGKDCPIVVENLRLPYATRGPTRVNQRMTLPQQRIFDPDMQMRDDLDKALHQLDDWPLTAKVQFLPTVVEYLANQHERGTPYQKSHSRNHGRNQRFRGTFGVWGRLR